MCISVCVISSEKTSGHRAMQFEMGGGGVPEVGVSKKIS